MRILIVSNLYPPVAIGGYEMACAQVAAALHGRGHTISLLTSWSHLPGVSADPPWVARRLELNFFMPNLPAEEGAKQRTRHAAFCSSHGNTMALLDEIRRFRPDLVYLWYTVGIGAAALADLVTLTGVPWVQHLMAPGPAEIAAELPASVLGLFGGAGTAAYRSGRLIAMSEHLVSGIEAAIGTPFPQPPDIVPGWADLAGARPHLPYLRDGVARFVAAGRISAHKGIGLILEASAMLKAEGVRFSVDIYGAGDLAWAVGLAAALRVEDRVRLLGPCDQKALMALQADYDAFLFPTHEEEPFGFAPIEAAGCATPPILTARCGAAERLVDQVHALKISRSTAALAGAMRRVASGRVDLARMGRAGQRLVREDLSFARCMDRIEAILGDAARRRGPNRIDDASLPALIFLKHNLSLRMRFG